MPWASGCCAQQPLQLIPPNMCDMKPPPSSLPANSCVLDDRRLQTLCDLDIHRLHVAVQLLLCALLVVALARDAHAQPVRHALDACLPDLLVELRVETDVLGALIRRCDLPSAIRHTRSDERKIEARRVSKDCRACVLACRLDGTNHGLFSKTPNLLDGAWRALLELHTENLQATAESVRTRSVSYTHLTLPTIYSV